MSAMSGSGVIESTELVKFREQWKAEVKQRTIQAIASPTLSPQNAVTSSSSASARPEEYANSSIPTFPHDAVTPTYTCTQRSAISAHASMCLSSAVESYRLAVQYEQSGNLDEALRLYRHAFRLKPDVDKAYHKDELRLSPATNQGEASSEHKHYSNHCSKILLDAPVEELNKSLKSLSLAPQSTVTGVLASLIASFSHDLEFEPEDESASVPLRSLPDELVVLVLKKLDTTSIERFAVIDKKARVLSLDTGIWRYLVQKTYIPPQIPEELTFESIAHQYLLDYRRFYIEHPRVRLDGVYVAVCHYVRPGLGENAWVQVNHLITYHRYLRFFLDGTVMSLLANEAIEPQTVIPSLKPSLRMKGLLVGTWSLLGTKILIRDLVDPSGGNSRYTFQMTLTLRSRPSGRWNKLDFTGYDSIDTKTGEELPFPLKHERPFWFSKVRSYA
ncbi:hypothetical protein DFH11DRAFT_1634448 [Phellopilus nigrolimitatus]|nr:hypothetical protein DFH11DRAFT_1634448 [Phellopilus nigrolimitatus]